MKKDTKKTKVKFLVNLRIGCEGVFAFFPDQKYNSFEKDIFQSYAHLGQHSGCHIDFANESRKATPKEYKSLFEELENYCGYNLEIVDHNEPLISCRREPTEYEIKFGEGAIHYRDFTPSEIGLNKKGELKIRFRADDNLFYSTR